MGQWESAGKVKYDPVSDRTTFEPHWVILLCDKEIIRYYQHIYFKTNYKKLQTAAWGSHISIIRGEKPKIIKNWKMYDNKIIDFNYIYDGEFYTNDKHVWIKARSPKFDIIRESLGLSPKPFLDFHISIGSIPSNT